MKLLRWSGYGFLSLVVLLIALVFGARFADGPVGIIAGGAFTSGQPVVGDEPDWQFVRATDPVELQLIEPERSRTTWIVEHDGRIFIPCGYMTTTWGKLWKKWPIEAERDGRAILRVDGKLYQRQLARITIGPVLEPVVEKLSEKYAVGATVAAVHNDSPWIFELLPATL